MENDRLIFIGIIPDKHGSAVRVCPVGGKDAILRVDQRRLVFQYIMIGVNCSALFMSGVAGKDNVLQIDDAAF